MNNAKQIEGVFQTMDHQKPITGQTDKPVHDHTKAGAPASRQAEAKSQRRSVRHDTVWYSHGRDAIYNAVLEDRSISAFANELLADSDTDLQQEAREGAMQAAMDILVKTAKSGKVNLNLANAPAGMDAIGLRDLPLLQLRYAKLMTGNDEPALKEWRLATFASLERVIGTGVMKWAREDPAKKEATPQKVEIVGMPDRQTGTEIERDDKGNIIKSTQLETDAT